MDSIELNGIGRREIASRLRNVHGWPVARIAARLGVTPTAVSKMLRGPAVGPRIRSTRGGSCPPPARHVRAARLSDFVNA